jgi:spermidine synthase
MILLLRPQPRPWKTVIAGITTLTVLLISLGQTRDLQQYFLQKFYFVDLRNSPGFLAAIAPETMRPPVTRLRSHYQTADLVTDAQPSQFFYNLVSDKVVRQPDYPLDLRFYLNRDYQFYSGSDEIYHEWFVHVPLQITRLRPQRVLILGGGDGLILREILKHPSVEHVTNVELDPMVIKLAKEHPKLRRMNDGAFDDPRVAVVLADAFSWVRGTDEMFDVIYIDVPYPRSYGIAKLYSREFYTMVRRLLTPGGFVVMDAPDSDCTLTKSLWPVYLNTMHAAGFEQVEAMMSRFDLDDPEIQTRVRLAAERELERLSATDPRYRKLALNDAAAEVRRLLDIFLVQARQEFIVAFTRPTVLNDEWIDMGIEHLALRPLHLPLAITRDCNQTPQPTLTNSVLRPTLPPIKFANVDMP